jgi:hypothetical protein
VGFLDGVTSHEMCLAGVVLHSSAKGLGELMVDVSPAQPNQTPTLAHEIALADYRSLEQKKWWLAWADLVTCLSCTSQAP